MYIDNLDRLIYTRHLANNADKLIILSGYINVGPIIELAKTGLECEIIYGTFNSHKSKKPFCPRSHLQYCGLVNKKVRIYYSDIYNHSKIYCWIKENEVIDAISGSANFTNNGLSDFRESLFQIREKDYWSSKKLLNFYLKNSTLCTDLDKGIGFKEYTKTLEPKVDNSNKLFPMISKKPLIFRFPICNSDGDIFYGYNWGHSPKGHTNKSDSYIHFPSSLIREFPNFFPNNGINPKFGQGKNIQSLSGNSHRNSKPNAEFIFDDGAHMNISFEGTHNSKNSEGMFNKISSFPKKNILGIYIRKRLGLKTDSKITKDALLDYGRDFFEIEKIEGGDNEYFCNFNNDNEEFMVL